jgi:Protein of unknown function (DUF2281)
MNTGWKSRWHDHADDIVADSGDIRRGSALMNVPEQVAQLCQALPRDKQVEVLDFVEFLVSRQSHPTWTVEQRREVVARTMGSLRHTRTSSEAFAQRKQEEKASEERRWKA